MKTSKTKTIHEKELVTNEEEGMRQVYPHLIGQTGRAF